jgi:hypothetical protein
MGATPLDRTNAVLADKATTDLPVKMGNAAIPNLRDARALGRQAISNIVSNLQAVIDEIVERAKRRPNARTRSESILTESDIRFLEYFYGTLAQGGRFLGGAPEAAKLLRRYLDIESTGVESVPSRIYEDSPAVQREMELHRKEIREAVKTGKLPDDGNTSYSIHAGARASEDCAHAAGPRPPAKRLIFADADNERLKRANNRFWVQSYSVRTARVVTTTFVVTDCYEFEPFSKNLFTRLDQYGQQLILPDGLSEYLTRVGLARIFTYESSWTVKWSLSSGDAKR